MTQKNDMSTHTTTEYPSEGIKAELTTESFDGQKLDTSVSLSGEFCISWPDKGQFIERLGKLIDEYRV